MTDRDVRRAFERIELELVESMKRNLGRHLNEEEKEGFDWDMWQVEQLKALRGYQQNVSKTYSNRFKLINREIKNFIQDNAQVEALQSELSTLQKVDSGIVDNLLKGTQDGNITNDFFKVNTPKMDALIKAVDKDMSKAEYAMLRRHYDQYRKIIFDAQVYANSGAGTLKQAIDMASRDYLRAGINCIQYKDGRTVNIASYAEMAVRTANRRATLISAGEFRKQNGWHLVKISKYGGCSETCLPWQGKVYVDDVYSGGTKEEVQQTGYPLLSEAIAGGLFHPNCKHTATTYFPGMRDEGTAGALENPEGAKEHNKNQRMIQQKKRMAAGSLDPQNIKTAKAQQTIWEESDEKLLKERPELKRNYLKEKAYKYETSTKLPYDDDFNIPFQSNKKSKELTLTEVKEHSFSDGTYDARNPVIKKSNIYSLKNGCKIIIPANMNTEIQKIDLNDVASVLESMPVELSKFVKEVEVVDYKNPADTLIAKQYGKENFTSAAVGGDRKITFFPSKNNRNIEQIENIVYHEVGHILEDEYLKEKGIYLSESDSYMQMVKNDTAHIGKEYVSNYAKNVRNYREDLADAFKLYHLNNKKLKMEYPNRYAFIKEWMQWLEKK